MKGNADGFQRTASEDIYQNIKDNVLIELKKTFNPEFLNRVDEIVVFHPLEKEHLFSNNRSPGKRDQQANDGAGDFGRIRPGC